MESGEEKRNQDKMRRKLQMLATEKKLLDQFPEGCLHGPSRHDMKRILSALHFGPTTKEGCTIDACDIINAVQGADESPHDEDAEMERWRTMYEGMEFWDDVNDWKPLTWELEVQARTLEMESFKKMGVHKKVPRDVAKKMGCKVITTKWVDTNKGDTLRPNYRSRLVGREVPELHHLAVIDIKRAYFHAPVRRPIFIEVPKEDLEFGDEGSVGQLQLSLYGARDAAQNWAHGFLAEPWIPGGAHHCATLRIRPDVST